MEKEIRDEINSLKDRVKKLEGGLVRNESSQRIIEIDIEWPEADIGGLHFNKQKTHGVFEYKGEGCYCSRDILFLSARDTDDGTGSDMLSEYLDSEAVRDVFRRVLGDEVRVFIPEENQGVKKYNGVNCWYWLRPRFSGSAAHFANVNNHGHAHIGNVSAVGGCAPTFRVCLGEAL